MTARSELKVRVALGFSSLVLLLLLSLSLNAQTPDDPLQRNVTIIGRNIDFEDVLDQLTLQTKMRFIYSSSTVSLDKPVTLMARQQPLMDVLADISSQMNITFKRQGDYFVVKKDNTSLTKTDFAFAKPKLANSEDIDQEDVGENNLQANRLILNSNSPSYERDSKITNDLLNFSDKLKLKYQPLSVTENGYNRPRTRWFASAGLLLNDYGAGVEMQGGIPALHAIFNVSALGDGLYRIGYGLGTAIPLKPMVTANLAYTFASLNSTERDSWHNQYRAASHHHQIRLQANLSLSDHFSVRFGPTFNLLGTSYKYLPEPASAATASYRPAPTQQYLSPSQGYTRTVQYQFVPTPADYETLRSWVGFELGVAYRVNFSLHK